MNLIKHYHYFLSLVLFIALVYVVVYFDSNNSEAQLTLIVLFATALIYTFQLSTMNQQKELSKESFKNQERILEEQKNIAQKQYDFDVFQMRMNLRNELQNTFILSLSVNNQDISDDVNVRLASMARISNDIKFAFDTNKKLDELISMFQSSCSRLTNLAMDKKIIIECSEKKQSGQGYVIDYKNCLRVYSVGGASSRINQVVFDNLKITNKEEVIICGTIFKYINSAPTKYEIEDYLIALFDREIEQAKFLLKNIFDILDKGIVRS